MMAKRTDRIPEEVQQAIGAARFALRRAEARPEDVEAIAGALRAIGEVVARGRAEALEGLVTPGLVTAAGVSAILDRDGMEDALEGGAARLWERLRAHEEVPPDESDAGFEEEVTGLLRGRDEAELELLGAAAALGCPVAEVERVSTVRLVFDQVVRPEVWRLVELNEARGAAIARVAPGLQARFWWWHAGLGAPPDAAAQMASVARLVAAFPEARARFEALVRAQVAWGAAGEKGTSAPERAAPGRAARTLRGWLSRRPGVASGAGERELLALAAAPEDERTVLSTEHVEVSFSPPSSLILDLLSDLRPGARPRVELGGGRDLEAIAILGAEERFAVELPDGALDGEGVSVRLPLAGGDVEISLPPRGSA